MGKKHKEKGPPSLFSADGYDFDDSVELNQFDRLYQGLPSDLDDMDLDKEYRQVTKAAKKKLKLARKPKSVFGDDEEGHSYFRPPQAVEDQQVTPAEPVTPLPVPAASSNEPQSEDEVRYRHEARDGRIRGGPRHPGRR